MGKDIFISYARADIEKVKLIVDVLEAQGWSVWWDSAMLPGEGFHDVIETAIAKARAILVVWSRQSTGSDWVRGEAQEGLDRKILVPVRIDDAKPPVNFRSVHITDLSGGRIRDEASFATVFARMQQLQMKGAAASVRARQVSAKTGGMAPTKQATVVKRTPPVAVKREPSSASSQPRANASSPTRRLQIRAITLVGVVLAIGLGWKGLSGTNAKSGGDQPIIVRSSPLDGRPVEYFTHTPTGCKVPKNWEVVDGTPGAEEWAASVREPRSGILFLLVAPGSFVMGSPEDEEGREGNETQHKVEITRPFYLAATEFCMRNFARLGGQDEDGVPDLDLPVDRLTWNGARVVCQSMGCELPTEAQWEYAARAGTTSAFWWGATPAKGEGKANVYDLSAAQKYIYKAEFEFEDAFADCSPVGKFAPNDWGFFDMTGNVWEWCFDGYYGDLEADDVRDPVVQPITEDRVLRGGSWESNVADIRVANRYPAKVGDDPAKTSEEVRPWGVRPALTLF